MLNAHNAPIILFIYFIFDQELVESSVTSKKLPNVYKSCPKMISLEKWLILTPLQKLPKNVGDLGKLIVDKGFKNLPKVQKIAQSGHTGRKQQVGQ